VAINSYFASSTVNSCRAVSDSMRRINPASPALWNAVGRLNRSYSTTTFDGSLVFATPAGFGGFGFRVFAMLVPSTKWCVPEPGLWVVVPVVSHEQVRRQAGGAHRLPFLRHRQNETRVPG